MAEKLWWCNSHQRRATHICPTGYRTGMPECDPRLGGIMLPCSVVDLTDLVEITDDSDSGAENARQGA